MSSNFNYRTHEITSKKISQRKRDPRIIYLIKLLSKYKITIFSYEHARIQGTLFPWVLLEDSTKGRIQLSKQDWKNHGKITDDKLLSNLTTELSE